jgi:hypothetical protein
MSDVSDLMMINYQVSDHRTCPIQTCLTYRVLLYNASPWICFHSMVYFFLPPAGGNPGNSPAISSLLLPTCKVFGGNSSLSSDRSVPSGFVPPLLSQGISLGFNLLLSSPLFSYIASRFLWWRYSYDAIEHCSVKCLWVIGQFNSNLYSRVES